MATTKKTKATPKKEEAAIIPETFVQKNIKNITIAVLAVVVIVAGVLLYKEYVSSPMEEKASTELAQAQENFANELFDLALNGDSASVKGFLAIAEEYSGTDAGNLANLYAGLCYANLSKWEEAKTYLEEFDGTGDQMVSPAAIAALGNVYAHLEQLDKAADLLIKAARKADNNALSPEFLIQAGQILEHQGKNAEAVKLYQEIKDKYAQSPRYMEVDKLIEGARVK